MYKKNIYLPSNHLKKYIFLYKFTYVFVLFTYVNIAIKLPVYRGLYIFFSIKNNKNYFSENICPKIMPADIETLRLSVC